LELITGVNSDAGSNLVFLLSRHDLSIGSGDLKSSVEAGTVHGIGDGTSERVLGTGGAVVGSLGAVGDTVLGPSEGSALIKVEEGEFLLKAKPDFLVIVSVEGIGGNSTAVGGQRLSSRSVSIAHDQNIVLSIGPGSEGILEDPARSQDDLRIISRSLIGGGTIEVPSGKSIDSLGASGGDGARLGSALSLGVNPNVFGEDLAFRVGEGIESVDDGGVELGLSGLGLEVPDHVNGSGGAGGGAGGEGGDTAEDGKEGEGELHGYTLTVHVKWCCKK